MKTKSTAIFLLLVLLFFSQAFSQEMTVEDFMDEANTSIKTKNYKEAINSLNMAINEINKLVIAQTQDALPLQINGYTAEKENDDSEATSVMGMLGGGLSVERTYHKSPDDWEHYFKIAILGNSPLLASVNMMLSNSMFMSGTGSKIMKVDGIKCLLNDEGNGEFKFQMPLSSSLISIEGHGFANSDAFMAIVNKIPFADIKASLSE